MSTLRIGTSGWNYPDGKGTWNGIFYPPSRQRPRGFDELSFYAEHFDTVEVNSTFYGQPRADVCREVGRAHAGGLRVLGQAVSEVHAPEDVQQAASSRRCPRATAAATRAHWPARTGADLDEFRRGIDPLAGARQARRPARAVSAELQDRPAECDYLAALLRAFSGYPIAVELATAAGATTSATRSRCLNGFGAAWVQIDEPKFRFSIRQNYLPNVPGFYYMRLHGRNAAKWWTHEKAEDRYNYLYSADELAEFTETAGRRPRARQEGVSLHEQSLLGEVGRERRDDQAAARRADRRRVSAGVRRALSRAGAVAAHQQHCQARR